MYEYRASTQGVGVFSQQNIDGRQQSYTLYGAIIIINESAEVQNARRRICYRLYLTTCRYKWSTNERIADLCTLGNGRRIH